MTNPRTPAIQKVGATLTDADFLAKMKQSLPRHLSPERMARMVINQLQDNQQLQEIAVNNPGSIYRAVLQAADVGLEINGPLGHAYMVAYRNKKLGAKEAKLIPGYRGLVELMRRAGAVNHVQAAAVYEADHFEIELGLDPKLEHKPCVTGDRGELILTYAVAFYANGQRQFVWVPRSEIDKTMRRSPSKDKKGNVVGPWRDDFEPMAVKTAIRRLANIVPMAAEAAELDSMDESELEPIETSARETRSGRHAKPLEELSSPLDEPGAADSVEAEVMGEDPIGDSPEAPDEATEREELCSRIVDAWGRDYTEQAFADMGYPDVSQVPVEALRKIAADLERDE